MKLFPIGVVLGAFFCGAAFASEEEVLVPRKVSLWADGRKEFGKVGVTIEAGGDGEAYRIQAIKLTVAGKKLNVPKEQFKDLEDPLLNTADLRTEAGRSGQPLLYLTFR